MEGLRYQEAFDPEHLDKGEQAQIAALAGAMERGLELEDDPTTEAWVNGHVLREVGEDLAEEGYKDDPKTEKHELSESDAAQILETLSSKKDLKMKITEIYAPD